MKNIRQFLFAAVLSTLSLAAVAQDKAETVDPRIQQLAQAKVKILTDYLTLTPDQQSTVALILTKYDDLTTVNNTNYSITRNAEREIWEVITPQQMEQYKNNMDKIHADFAAVPAPAAANAPSFQMQGK